MDLPPLGFSGVVGLKKEDLFLPLWAEGQICFPTRVPLSTLSPIWGYPYTGIRLYGEPSVRGYPYIRDPATQGPPYTGDTLYLHLYTYTYIRLYRGTCI